MKYKFLNVKNPEYNEFNVRKLELMYCGGEEIIENAQLFIHKQAGEQTMSYNNRLQCASYKNEFAKIVNDFVSCTFSKSFSVIPAADASDNETFGQDLSAEADATYGQFAVDADLQKTPLSNVLRKLLTKACCVGYAYLGVDFPNSEQLASNLLEEEILGLSRPYVYHIPALSVLDWEYDEFGKYKFVVLKKEIVNRGSLGKLRDTKIIQFKVWIKENGEVKYTTYQIEVKAGKEPRPDDECVEIPELSGIVSFKEIPIMCLKTPKSLWIGNLIGKLQEEHFVRYSSLVYAYNRSLFALPVYKQSPELSANGDLSELQANPNRGLSTSINMKTRGFAVIASGDDISFVEPTGRAYELVNNQLKELIDDMHRIAGQMSSSISASSSVLARSGLSKMMDHHGKEMVLLSYGALVKEFAIELYGLISNAREKDGKIVWQAIGMDDYKIIDKNLLIQEVTANQAIQKACPSRTLYKHNAARLAFEFNDNLTPEEQLVIKNELDTYFDSKSDQELFGGLQEPLESKDSENSKPPGQ